MFIYDATNDNYYQALSADATRTIIDTSPNAAADGTATLRFFSRWYVDGATDNAYVTFYDNDLKKLGAEMYSYLNLQVNDVGITGTDFRYKYAAYNGSRVLYGGFPDDNFTYFSVADRPDIVPALNIVRHQYTVKGIASAGRDFYVFSDRNAERVSIYSSNEAEQDSEFLNVGAVSHRAIVAPSDEVVAVMTYKGPMLISNRRPIEIGKHLNDWWLSTFTKAQMEACVAGYNHMNDEIIFSFPTYATSPYTTGIVFVFDMNAWREQTALSPWWILKTDAAIKAMDLNNQLHLIGGMATKIVDFDSASGTETVSTSYKMKMLQGPIPNKEVRWDRLYVDVETSDTVAGALYYDGSASSVALTLNTDLNGFIRYLSKTLEVELTTSASTNSVEHKGMLLTFTPKRV